MVSAPGREPSPSPIRRPARRRLLALPVALLAAGLALAGCSSDSGSGSDNQAAGTTPATSAPSTLLPTAATGGTGAAKPGSKFCAAVADQKELFSKELPQLQGNQSRLPDFERKAKAIGARMVAYAPKDKAADIRLTNKLTLLSARGQFDPTAQAALSKLVQDQATQKSIVTVQMYLRQTCPNA